MYMMGIGDTPVFVRDAKEKTMAQIHTHTIAEENVQPEISDRAGRTRGGLNSEHMGMLSTQCLSKGMAKQETLIIREAHDITRFEPTQIGGRIPRIEVQAEKGEVPCV
jgi:hypothetical protein